MILNVCTVNGHCGRVGHMTKIVCINFHCPDLHRRNGFKMLSPEKCPGTTTPDTQITPPENPALRLALKRLKWDNIVDKNKGNHRRRGEVHKELLLELKLESF